MHTSRTYDAFIARLVMLRAQTGQGYFVAGPDLDVCRPTSGGAGVEFRPVVFVAALRSRVGSV